MNPGKIDACRVAGAIAIFGATGLSHLVRPPFYGRLFLRALVEIGYFSLPVVALTAIFTGMVLALQSYTGFARFSAESAIASLVVLSVTRELGPVLAGLMVAGRPCIGSWLSYGLGSMNQNLPTFVVLQAKHNHPKANVQAISARLWSAGFLSGQYSGVKSSVLEGMQPGGSRPTRTYSLASGKNASALVASGPLNG